MSSVGNSKRRIARKVTAATALALAAMLAACGGNGNNDDASSASNATVTPPVSPDTAASDTPPTSTSFFDSVFLDGVGAGYYQFDKNGPGLHPTATGRLRIYVTADANTNFSETPTAILGPYVEDNDAYVTADGSCIDETHVQSTESVIPRGNLSLDTETSPEKSAARLF
jgi:hypothetical protein